MSLRPSLKLSSVIVICVVFGMVLSACSSAATPGPQLATYASAPQQPAMDSTYCCSTGGNKTPNDKAYDATFFENYGVNPFIDTEDDNLSTFAMDVDTASYTVIRRFLTDGNLPDKDAVRTEEVLNYFDLHYPNPTDGAFGINLEAAPSPFGGEKYWLVKVGLQGRTIPTESRKDAILTFVIDVSGSMDMENRLGTVKRALHMLVEQLRPTDQVAIVVYGTTAHAILEPTPATRADDILAAIDRLQSEGSTNAEAGLRLGYQLAASAARPDTINRIILCSDGVANVGNTGADLILRTIEDYAAKDIYLSTVGFGMGNYNDVLMEQLADKGNGNYAYVDTLEEARRIFVENLTGTLQVIAKDAKIQVEFNPQVVSRYRLLGYENRDLADNQFRDDKVDAGEVGSGHSVTALYEIKFQDKAQGEAMIVRVRYQDPDSGKVIEVAQKLQSSEVHPTFEAASPEFHLAAAVAEYAEILRKSYWAKDSQMSNVLALMHQVQTKLPEDKQVTEFITLVEQAARLTD